MVLAFHKPYGCLSQFTANGSSHRTLADFGFPAGVYPLGRLDADSEGLLLLSDEAGLNSKLLDPKNAHRRTYWAQVEGIPSPNSLKKFEQGLWIQDYQTLPATSWLLDPQPTLPPRDPPIRVRKTVSDCWIALELIEGKNRQVRRMTAAIGHATLRLLRVSIGNLELGDLSAGTWKKISEKQRRLLLAL
jgi:23S rRNA pseudouridine2457 synthase